MSADLYDPLPAPQQLPRVAVLPDGRFALRIGLEYPGEAHGQTWEVREYRTAAMSGSGLVEGWRHVGYMTDEQLDELGARVLSVVDVAAPAAAVRSARPPRQLIVVDVETNGLDPAKHVAVEVAWWNLSTDRRGYFVPRHDVDEVLAAASERALEVNGYRERLVDAPQDDGTGVRELYEQLRGVLELGDDPAKPPRWRAHTLTGANPTFDAAMLSGLFSRTPYGLLYPRDEPLPELPLQPWHYRMWDVSAYAAGVFGLDELPGLSAVCDLVGVEHGDHRADSDVTAAGLCVRELKGIAAHIAPGLVRVP